MSRIYFITFTIAVHITHYSKRIATYKIISKYKNSTLIVISSKTCSYIKKINKCIEMMLNTYIAAAKKKG